MNESIAEIVKSEELSVIDTDGDKKIHTKMGS